MLEKDVFVQRGEATVDEVFFGELEEHSAGTMGDGFGFTGCS